MENWKKYQECIDDELLLDLMDFGFPVDYQGKFMPVSAPHNHNSATFFPQDIQRYIDEELKEGALLGPFKEPPFEWVVCNALMSREKRVSTKR